MKISATPPHPWAGWQKLLFRFFFLLFFLFITPFSFLEGIPWSEKVLQYVYDGMDALFKLFNQWFFHIAPATKPPNGNGDFPEQWMQVCSILLLTVTGTIIWTIVGRKQKEYTKLNYWLCLGLRYFLIANGLSYGLIKMFHLQMPHPNLSQLATPLGDYLPMRFSWMFVGYSTPYEFFSGTIEVLAAVLLLFRRTATLGILVATGVFANVMMLNLSYDIPVKINSIFLVVVCFYLLALELPRLIAFFFRNEAKLSSILVFPFETKRGKILAIAGKWLFIGLALYGNFTSCFERMKANNAQKMPAPIQAGVYDVLLQVNHNDTLTTSQPDSLYWQNMVFDKGYEGSIKTSDTRFRQRYGRGYFSFQIDSAKYLLTLTKTKQDSVAITQFNYVLKDGGLIELRSYPKADSLYLLLRKRIKPFPLSEEQFHWVSETNR